MLWYKAWRENRTRFAITASVLLVLCGFATLSSRQLGQFGAGGRSARIDHMIYAGTAKGLFAILSIFLGSGGLLRERARRTAIFTLALPVSRLGLVGTQIGMGLLELAALSFLPALCIPILSRFTRAPYPFIYAIHFGLLWFSCGVIIFAVAYFLSAVLEGEYTAAVVCYIALSLQALIASWAPLKPYHLNLLTTMAEFPAIPWERLLTLALISLGLFGLAAWHTQKEDF
jgi:ABC-type transport system involved in multi-copper enzyme maturation permease subunit